ncbi:MAG: thiamine phosphate synthase [Bryobacteraceae bacterium]
MKHLPDWRLYLVTDRSLARGRSITCVVEAAVRGGVTAVQLREKSCGTGDFVQLGRELKKLLAPFQVPLIVNDRVDVALAIGADGVHIGQRDMDFNRARRLLGPDAIIGLSIETIEQARAAVKLDVDYLGVGPVFATATKIDAAPPLGVGTLAQVRAITRHAIVAIGGIGLENARQVIHSGADGVAVISAICAADDPERTARELRQSIDAALQSRSLPCRTRAPEDDYTQPQ